MRKTQITFVVKLGLLLLLLAALMGCQVKSQTLGVFASTDTCAQCHSSQPKFPVKGATLGYDYSGHKNGYHMEWQNSYYANGDGCQQCHTNEGFIQFATTGSVDKDGFIEYPSQIGCFTCHDPHKTADFSLRKDTPDALVSGVSFDLKKGNLCANCHRARRGGAAVKATPADKVSPYFGPHHGPQADVLLGSSAYEYPGKTYGSSDHKTVTKDGCVTCHMSLPQKRYSLSPELGGHSFSMEGEVHGEEKLNVGACLTCHSDMKQTKEGTYFAIEAEEDYDQDGQVEPVQLEVKGLLAMFVNDEGTGVLQTLDPPLYNAKGSFNRISENSTERSAAEIGALFNYKLMLEDRSLGVHNTKYTIQVLYDSLKAIDPSFNDGKRPL